MLPLLDRAENAGALSIMSGFLTRIGALGLVVFLVLATEVIGIATLVWIRFRRFPPILAAHEVRLARERYYSTQKFADPEATIRRRSSRRQQRRRR